MRFSAGINLAICLFAAAPALAQEAAPADEGAAPDQTFTLGQIVVTAPRSTDAPITSESVSSEALYLFNRNSLDEAASLIPGVTTSNSGGSRNERLINVRGFDRFQVPLSIDGIRVYLPADNRLDYGRFLTPDVAEIQVAKGYASVLDGPGALGGAINLVTRKPTRKIEAEARGTLSLDRDADYAGYNVFALLGTRQDNWYAQASYTRNVRNHFDLAGGFAPTPNENGGEREFADTRDWRVNAKIGFTPNATDEYALSYTRQEGAKNAPLHVDDTVLTRFWSWPTWNLESVYFLSTTALGDRATLKTRLYRNTFYNLLRSFNDRTQTTQSLGRAFNSTYDDEAYGGSAELGVDLSAADRFSIATHYRRDRHVEYQQSFPGGVTEPRQVTTEDTFSIAAENLLTIAPAVTLRAGASYDWRDLKRAEDYTANAFVFYPLRNSGAWNAQARLEYRPEDALEIHASISSRARFPTIFERFSSRFGGATSNADLKAERATNYELGAARQFGVVRLEAAGFYSDLDDVIVAIPFVFNGQAVTQSRNVGSGRYYGGEASLSATLSPALSLGANYTYTHRDLDDPSNAAFQPTGVPTHKGFAYADWSPVTRLHVVPNLDFASNRWTVNSAGTLYYRIGSYVLANLRVDYEVIDGVEIGVGARNLFDDDYRLTDGFPEEGRSFFASVRARY